MGEYEQVSYQVADRVATVTLDRPEARNGYTVRMATELADALGRADDDEDVRAVVLTGRGEHFCVGADLSAGGLQEGDMPTDGETWLEPAGRCSRRIYAMSKPVIAAMRGASVGAGSTIVLPCDFRLASTDSRFGFVFTRRGIYPEGGSSWHLPRLVGTTRAFDWMITGRVFDADEALAAGLVTSVHEPDEVLDAAHRLAADIAENTAPVAVAVARGLLHRMSGADDPFELHEVESRLIARLLHTPDAIEGVMAFMQKRQPQFTMKVGEDMPEHLPWRQG